MFFIDFGELERREANQSNADEESNDNNGDQVSTFEALRTAFKDGDMIFGLIAAPISYATMGAGENVNVSVRQCQTKT
jgi:hypothetical protein